MGCGASTGPPPAEEPAEQEEEKPDGADEEDNDDEEDGLMPLPEVSLVDETEETAEAVDLDSVPDYWVNKQIADDSSSFNDFFYVPPEQHAAFNEILMSTYLPRVTQDRPCPTGEHVHYKGGCPCVRPDGDPGLPVSYHVRRVIRVEDSEMWAKYVKKREAIREARGDEKFRTFYPPMKSDEVAARHPELFAPLANKINEVYLFHGTRVRYALSIAEDDFRIDLAGSSRGTMYGPGAYLAESSTKADEYANDEEGGYYQGVFAMLICRVCMGKLYYTRKRCPEAGEKIAEGHYDSTCGDRSNPPINTFRELVVYNSDQLYPEYIVLYQRAFKADNPEEVAEFCSLPYHIELPLYWSNTSKDPNNEESSFDSQYLVRPATKSLLQRLVDAAGLEGKWQIGQARRIEIASVWRRYVGCKLCLRARVPDENGYADKLEDPEVPAAVLASIAADVEGSERSISLEDLEEPINEHLLWCPASKEAAEWLARGVECGAQVDLPLEDVRFYTSLRTSLSKVEDSGDGTRHVLLCRVACGDPVVTSDPEVQQTGDLAKDSFILEMTEESAGHSIRVMREEQVYVEYILEMTFEEE